MSREAARLLLLDVHDRVFGVGCYARGARLADLACTILAEALVAPVFFGQGFTRDGHRRWAR